MLAIAAIKNQEISTIHEAARLFDVPCTTLEHCLVSHTTCAETRANGHKLTETEEESLIQWILSMNQHGAAPWPATVQEMVNLLLKARGSTPVQKLHTTNEKQKQKRSHSTRQIPHEGDLSVEEACTIISKPIEVQIAHTTLSHECASPALQPRQRALLKCGGCGDIGHKRTACPNRPR